jgi:quercetin dioxygenase-like cupin family protein
MSRAAGAERFAHLVDPRTVETVDVLGPTIQFLTSPDEGKDAPCVMRGTIPPDGVVPLHSHADPETFLAISGEFEGLVSAAEGFDWVPIVPGDVFHVPGDVGHAFRNRSREPAVMILVATARIGRFFQETGTPLAAGRMAAGPPSGEAIERFLEIAERYGYWNASPAENAAVGVAI